MLYVQKHLFVKVKNMYIYTLILPLSAADFSPLEVAAVAKYWMTRLVFTVFPAPDSPLVINAYIQRNAVSEFVYTIKFFLNKCLLADDGNLRDQDRLVLFVCKM